MNVLLTCAGRRNFLVRFFRDALAGAGKVLACDASAYAPAFAETAHRFVVPALDHPDYFGVLLNICREQRVRLLVSVNDLELDGLARHAGRFREVGTIAVISAPEVVATCQDKWAAYRWLVKAGLATPTTCLTLADTRQALAAGTMRFPLVIKPRWGSSSIGIERVEDARELELGYEWAKIQVGRSMFATLSKADRERTVLIQQFLQGQEYGIDVVNDLSGRYVSTLARRKLAMRAGNTDRAVTVAEPHLEHLGRQLGERLGHQGSLDCDIMATENGYQVLDLNPRLGGGYPFSHLAGADLPRTLVAWARGESPDPNWLKTSPGVVASKYDEVVVMDQPGLDTDPVRVNASDALLPESTLPRDAPARAPLPAR